MRPTTHAVASVLTSTAFYAVSHSVPGTLACFLSGIFIDIDHHFDLWLFRKKIVLDPRDLFHFCEKEKEGKMYLIFHSYELLTIFGLCLFIFHLSDLWWGLWIGMVVHIILDQIANPLKPGVYFFWYRAKINFCKKTMFSEDYYREME